MSIITTLAPEITDREQAVTALRGLDIVLTTDRPVQLIFDGQALDVELPRPAMAALVQVLESFSRGEAVTLLPSRAELTTQQAADALNVSRPFLIGLLDDGKIEYRTVGSHRRVEAASLIRYLQQDDVRRTAAADELARETRSTWIHDSSEQSQEAVLCTVESEDALPRS